MLNGTGALESDLILLPCLTSSKSSNLVFKDSEGFSVPSDGKYSGLFKSGATPFFCFLLA
jgi:hypothetical protein